MIPTRKWKTKGGDNGHEVQARPAAPARDVRSADVGGGGARASGRMRALPALEHALAADRRRGAVAAGARLRRGKGTARAALPGPSGARLRARVGAAPPAR